MPEPWDSIGLEIEYVDVDPKQDPDLKYLLENWGYKITHDASVESPTKLLGGRPVRGATFDREINAAVIKNGVIGGELVSSILNTSTKAWLEPAAVIFTKLKNLGERVTTSRGSIHVHVNFPYDHPSEHRHTLGILRRAWMLAGFTEAFFYRIGGLSKDQRGKCMDYIYYRPITGNGPPIVMSGFDGSFRPVLNYDQVLHSKGTDEFFLRCGDIYSAESRYHPCRYFWINFYNLRQPAPHIEFRVFNKTLRWDYLYAVVELCKAFVKVCYTSGGDYVEGVTKSRVVGLAQASEIDWDSYFKEVINLLGIKDDTLLSLLKTIWEKTPPPAYDDIPMYSHINRSNIFASKTFNSFFPKPLNKEELRKVRHANFIDVHKLHDMGEFIFPEEDDGCAN